MSSPRRPRLAVLVLLLVSSLAIGGSGVAVARSRQGTIYRATLRKSETATYRVRLVAQRKVDNEKISSDMKLMIDETVDAVTPRGANLTHTITFDRAQVDDEATGGYAMTTKSKVSRAGVVTDIVDPVFDDTPLFDLIWPQALHAALPATKIREGSTWTQPARRASAVSIKPVGGRISSRLVEETPERLRLVSVATTPLDLHVVGSEARYLVGAYYPDDDGGDKYEDSDLFLRGVATSKITQTLDAKTGRLMRASGTAKISVIAGVDIPTDAPKVADSYRVAVTIERLASSPKEVKERATHAATIIDDHAARVRLLDALDLQGYVVEDTGRFFTTAGEDLEALRRWERQIAWGKLDGGVEILIPSKHTGPSGQLLLMRSRGKHGNTWCLAVVAERAYLAVNRVTAECPKLTAQMDGWFDLSGEDEEDSADAGVA